MPKIDTEAIEPDPIKSVDGNVVFVHEVASRHAGGRPRKLTVAKFLQICSWIQQGRSNHLACRIENIDYGGFCTHVRNKPRWKKRYQHADAIRDDSICDFHLANIERHAEKNWAASAWILERKFPQRFALHFSTRDITAENAAHYAGLTREQLLAALETSQRVELEAPKGFETKAIEAGTE